MLGMKTQGKRLMEKPTEFSCGLNSGILMNCIDDCECTLNGYIKCVKGYCCSLIEDAAPMGSPPPTQLILPSTMMSSSGHNNERRWRYSLILPSYLSTTTPRQLSAHEDDIDEKNFQGDDEWYKKGWVLDDIIGMIDWKDDESSGTMGVPYDNKEDDNQLIESNNLNTQIMALDDQSNKPLENQDDQSGGKGNIKDGPFESFDEATNITRTDEIDELRVRDNVASEENMENKLKRPSKSLDDQSNQSATDDMKDVPSRKTKSRKVKGIKNPSTKIRGWIKEHQGDAPFIETPIDFRWIDKLTTRIETINKQKENGD